MLVHHRYEPREILGRGAQGAVVRVIDRESASSAPLVAKIWSSGKFERETLASEFALLARFRIRGLARVWDFGFDETTGAPFFVEDFVEGQAFDRALAGAAPQARDHVVAAVLADVLETLTALHEGGFVHGDLKPAHVRVDRSGHPVLLDLGAAVLRGARARGFTDGFCAPEIRGGAPKSAQSDLWSLGATFVFAITGDVPSGKPLRAAAPYLRASVAELVDRMVAHHPRDRPESARDALEALGKSASGDALLGARPPPVGRASELAWLRRENAPDVQWLVGPPGVGKSFLGDELSIEALRAGCAVRTFRFPETGDSRLGPLLSYLRGTEAAWPFAAAPNPRTWLIFDALDAAPAEVTQAIEAYRCRAAGGVRVLAIARTAPAEASALVLAPLARADFETLCRALHVEGVEAAWQASAGIPAWAAATAGRLPLTADAALARARSLAHDAERALAVISILGGVLRAPLRQQMGVPATALAALIENGLLSRNDEGHVASQRALAGDRANALASCAIVDEIATALLVDPTVATATKLPLLATAPYPPTRRSELLASAASAARTEALPIAESAALLELLVDPAERSPVRLLRLERLTRDTANASAQERVFEWLGAAVGEAPIGQSELECIFFRRSAERAARRGANDEANAFVARAIAIAPDDASRALVIATRGTVALFSAQWTRALEDYVEARAALRHLTSVDAEEIARLDHNLGVVALYKEDVARAEQAFARSLVSKRALGDMAGTRSVLLNLGIARTRAGLYELAARDLDEAIRLARALGQRGGLAWCRVARVDLALRVGDVDQADAQQSEATALADAMTPPVRADFALIVARIAVARGRGRDALAAIAGIDAALRRDDPMIDARAHAVRGDALLAVLPADRSGAVRAAIAAIRRAREGKIGEIEAAAVACLRRARDRRTVHVMKGGATVASDIEPMILACALAAGDASVTTLLREVVRVTRAERAFAVTGADTVIGVDLDGLAIADAAQRLPISRESIGAGVRSIRDAETTGGRGSHVVARIDAADAAALVLEHRFSPSHFDDVAEARLLAWAALLAIVARPGAATPSAVSARSATSSGVASSVAASTAMPFVEARRSFPDIIGLAVTLKRALARLDTAIDSDLPTLVLGETGVGKELFARALHDLGERARGPFVAVNCAAIPDSLFEAELFGHARGAFTGADRDRRGLLARADGGTLFLDEIGELAILRQATLLRALETRRYRPVGSDDERAFDVRIVSATNRDLSAEVERGAFRRDLLYRLCVLEIPVPSLRERREDIPLLLRHYLVGIEIEPDAMDALCNYGWPGNVRELANAVERATLMHDGGELEVELPESPLKELPGLAGESGGGAGSATRDILLDLTLEQLQRLHITHALEACGYKVHGPGGAAVKLDVHPATLLSRMDKFGIPRPRLMKRERRGK
ncbi:hypothetical protein BH09MYX1_BH09MYX1_22480 [soil metagenome]